MVFFFIISWPSSGCQGCQVSATRRPYTQVHWQYGIKPQNVHNFHQNHYKVPHLKFLTPGILTGTWPPGILTGARWPDFNIYWNIGCDTSNFWEKFAKSNYDAINYFFSHLVAILWLPGVPGCQVPGNRWPYWLISLAIYGVTSQNMHNFSQNHYKVPKYNFSHQLATWHLGRCQVANRPHNR